MGKAAFPGSFDPPTLGHLDIIERAAALFDELVVVVAESHQKKYLFPLEKRTALIRELVQPWKNVSVASWDSLITDFAGKHGVSILIRGIRSFADFSYESEMAQVNRMLNPGLETVCIFSDPRFVSFSSSGVKELASFGGDFSAMVPPPAARALAELLRGKNAY